MHITIASSFSLLCSQCEGGCKNCAPIHVNAMKDVQGNGHVDRMLETLCIWFDLVPLRT